MASGSIFLIAALGIEPWRREFAADRTYPFSIKRHWIKANRFMGYRLQALIGHELPLRGAAQGLGKAVVVALGRDLGMIPLSDDLFDEFRVARGATGEDPFPGFQRLSAAVAQWIAGASRGATLAYVEADYAGGKGEQSAVVWKDGAILEGPLHSRDAINRSLRLLGLSADPGLDEFDTVRLGRHRTMEDWIGEA